MIILNGIQSPLGGQTDFVGVPYSFGSNSVMGFLTTGYYHVHGQAFVYPSLANAVTLTSGAGAWGVGGSIVEIIPAGALSVSAFDLHWIQVTSISANAEYEIIVYAGDGGSEVRIGGVRGERNTVQSQEGNQPIQIPQQARNTRISARLCDSTVGTITCKIAFMGHYYA